MIRRRSLPGRIRYSLPHFRRQYALLRSAGNGRRRAALIALRFTLLLFR
jgi:hypothetical protein